MGVGDGQSDTQLQSWARLVWQAAVCGGHPFLWNLSRYPSARILQSPSPLRRESREESSSALQARSFPGKSGACKKGRGPPTQAATDFDQLRARLSAALPHAHFGGTTPQSG
mmetsp:Transcript_43992/g.79058  ORF Transcript_43992/g.79058 Transcript_43992/m.79058 type:complete len:112 (-) Transcript_43992:109-444(-)